MIKTSRASLVIFLGPALTIIGLLMIYPIFYSLNLSLYEASGSEFIAGNTRYIGFKNYLTMMQDTSFWHSSKLLIYYIISTTFIEVGLALAIAIYLEQIIKLPPKFNALFLLPMFVIPVVSGLTFRFIFDPESGVFATIYFWFNMEAPDFLGDPTLAFTTVIAQDVWRMWPFIFVILYAGLKSLDKEILNAAKIDGATPLQRFWYIILPAMKATILISILLKTIESFKAFTEIYVMTGGGPGESTSILSMYIIKQLTDFNRYGFGSAISVVLLLCAMIFAMTYGYMLSKEEQS